jgi:hypothetical protein
MSQCNQVTALHASHSGRKMRGKERAYPTLQFLLLSASVPLEATPARIETHN